MAGIDQWRRASSLVAKWTGIIFPRTDGLDGSACRNQTRVSCRQFNAACGRSLLPAPAGLLRSPVRHLARRHALRRNQGGPGKRVTVTAGARSQLAGGVEAARRAVQLDRLPLPPELPHAA